MNKPGYKTSEFWLSVAAVVIGAVMGSGVLDQSATPADNQIFGLLASVLGALGYTVSRAWTKGNEAKRDAVVAASAAASGPPANPPKP
jgi:drug/metabolite transporter (DMT)-like permease